jgi:SAM-dependent methyltransferase
MPLLRERIPLPVRQALRPVRRFLRHLCGRNDEFDFPIAEGYEVVESTGPRAAHGWQERLVAERQHRAFQPLLEAARRGAPRLDFSVAAEAVATTAAADPLIVEVGCGSGYYSEVLPLLLNHPLRYIGIDYSHAMTVCGRRTYPHVPFLTGDACRLPLPNAACDILLSGTSLMHIPDYPEAIRESTRVSRAWCIFHTVPVMVSRATTFLRKQAYGRPVVEILFNQGELEAAFRAAGLTVCRTWESIPHDLSATVGERTWTMTYLCRKGA